MLLVMSKLAIGEVEVPIPLAALGIIRRRRTGVGEVGLEPFYGAPVDATQVVCHQMGGRGEEPRLRVRVRAPAAVNRLEQAHKYVAGDVFGELIVVQTKPHVAINVAEVLIVGGSDSLRVKVP